MRARTVEPSAADSAGPAAGCWKLSPGHALSLYPCSAGVLEIVQGRVWLTLRGTLERPPDDHDLQAGARLHVAPGQHLVLQAWNPPGVTDAVAFRWDVMPGAGKYGYKRPGCSATG